MEIEETALPGIGLRHEFTTRGGRRVGVISHHKGRRELVIYDADDPDGVAESLLLTAEEGDVLSELLGAPHIVEKLDQLSKVFAGLVGEQIRISPDSPYAGRPLGYTQAEFELQEMADSFNRSGHGHRVRRRLERPFGSVRWKADSPDPYRGTVGYIGP